MQNKKVCYIISKYIKIVINFLVMMTFREIPVPIPNTEVKPKCAENTCGLPCWKDRLLPDLYIFLVSSVGRALGCEANLPRLKLAAL